MKKYIKYCIILVVAAFFVASCNDNFLDLTPDGRITLDETFQDQRLTEGYLNAIYNSRQKYGTYYHNWAMLAGFSDEAQDSDALTQSWTPVARFTRGDITTTIPPFSTGGANRNRDNGWEWEKNWEAIRKANVFLANIDDANILNTAHKARMKAEAQILRAFFYMEQIKMYGPMPTLSEVLPETFDFSTLERDTFQSNIDFIVSDLNAAIAEPNMPWRVNENERGRFSKAAAHAIKSEALLFNASPLWNPGNDQSKWQQAAVAGREALQGLTSNGYELYPDYEEYFHNKRDLGSAPADRETIWEIKEVSGQFNFGMLMFRMNNTPIPGVTADMAGACPSQNLVDSYEMANGEVPILGYHDEDRLQPIINPASGYDESNPYVNRDPRFYATVWYNMAEYGVINNVLQFVETYVGGAQGIVTNRTRTHTGYYLRKFRDPAVTNANSANSKNVKYRLAEIYLNFAEAENEANGPTAEVYSAVNTVRARVGMPALPNGLSQDEMRQRIRNERRVELAYEEKRFWDVRRWNILAETDRVITGKRWTRIDDDNFSGQRIVVHRRGSADPKFLLFPVPQNELNRLQVLGQNPGW